MNELPPDPASACTFVDGPDDCGVLILCDHASSALPAEHGTLGLLAEALQRHIAYDIGAAEVALRLAERLRAPAVLTRFSRLLIDPNRGADDPTLVMRISDGALIPGNARIDAARIEYRRRLYWQPYRDAVAARLDRMCASGNVPAILSIHSFTPVWKGSARPWDVGILWDSDPRLPRPFMQELRAMGLVVGDNEPYDGALEGDTMDAHGNARGLANMLIEVRQDLIGSAEAARAFADRLVPPLTRVLADPAVHRVEHYRSRAGARRFRSEETET